MMDPETTVFKLIIEKEALTTSSWRKYFRHLTDVGINTIEDLLETTNETLEGLKEKIPEAPLGRIRALKERLFKIKAQSNNSFVSPLSESTFFDLFEFVPQFTCDQYLNDTSMNNITDEIRKAKSKVTTVGSTGLTEHQAIFIAMYCQESTSGSPSFYCLINQCLRERNEQLLAMRPALYLLDSGLRRLPMIKDVTWRGMNVAPDLKKFVAGQSVIFSSICSTSTDKDQTLRFMEVPPQQATHKRTLFKMRMEFGVSIQQWSCWPQEQEVVALPCSRWKVISVEHNRDEHFDSIGSYHCDYYIELRQIPNEPLFRSNIKLTGLHLLSKLNFEKPNDLAIDFKSKFLGFFHQLEDPSSQAILESVLLYKNYWNQENKMFKNNPENGEIFELITHFLEGVRSLATEFEHHGIDPRQGFKICETHGIYAAVDLLFNKEHCGERTATDFEELGFDKKSSLNLYNQKHVKEELQLLYRRLNYSGTVEEPRNISKWLSTERFKHYIKKDGITISTYELAHLSMNGAKQILPRLRSLLNGSVQFDNFTMLGKAVSYEIQHTDFVIAAAIFAVQFGMYCFQLWHGDITIRQFFKCITTCAVSVGCGFAGGFGAGFFVAGCAVALGIAGWPATIAVLLGTAVGGLVFGGAADALFRYLTEKYFPDGENEEINAQRKLYYAALDTLACNPDSDSSTIQRAYFRRARAIHPDKCENKKVAEEDFKRLVSAYEIVKNYHAVLADARRLLNIPEKYTMEHLKVCKSTLGDDAGRKRAYTVAYRHIAYNSSEWKRFRNWLDSDKKIKLRDGDPLAIK